MPRLVLLAALALVGCGYPRTPPALSPVTLPASPAAPRAAVARSQVTILVSIDGFRPDYLGRGVTPNLSRLARGGVAGTMRPAFPARTFPNHWAMATGVRPDRSGIVGNVMIDPGRPGETFTAASDDPFWWNAAEPIWVTAERAGLRTAAMGWPGSAVAWGGVRVAGGAVEGGTRPSDWQPYAEAVSGAQRVRGVIDWLRRPAATRPRFVALYLDSVDAAGHRFGPDDPRTTAAVADADTAVGELVKGLAGLGLAADILIVSDHGMAATSSARTVALDTVVPPADARIVEAGAYASFVPAAGRDLAVANALLRPRPHMTCWRKSTIPARFGYGANPRVPPFLCLGEEGWTLAKTAPAVPFAGGAHGYDPALAEMQAVFIASGPSFAAGRRTGAAATVDVAPLLRDLLGLPAGAGLDGSDAPFRAALR